MADIEKNIALVVLCCVHCMEINIVQLHAFLKYCEVWPNSQNVAFLHALVQPWQKEDLCV